MSRLTLAAMERHTLLSSASLSTSDIFPHPSGKQLLDTIHVFHPMSSSCSSSFYHSQKALPLQTSSPQYVSNKTCLTPYYRQQLSYPLAICNTSSFVLLAVHGILIILLMNHISAASSLLFIPTGDPLRTTD